MLSNLIRPISVKKFLDATKFTHFWFLVVCCIKTAIQCRLTVTYINIIPRATSQRAMSFWRLNTGRITRRNVHHPITDKVVSRSQMDVDWIIDQIYLITASASDLTHNSLIWYNAYNRRLRMNTVNYEQQSYKCLHSPCVASPVRKPTREAQGSADRSMKSPSLFPLFCSTNL